MVVSFSYFFWNSASQYNDEPVVNIHNYLSDIVDIALIGNYTRIKKRFKLFLIKYGEEKSLW